MNEATEGLLTLLGLIASVFVALVVAGCLMVYKRKDRD
jgi:hypothetical protein